MITSVPDCIVLDVTKGTALVHCVPERINVIDGRFLRKPQKQDEWIFSFADDVELARLFAAFRDCGFSFLGGSHGWPPAAVFEDLRTKGMLSGPYQEAQNRGARAGWLVMSRD